jgi:sugar lactone lactonase YvrE
MKSLQICLLVLATTASLWATQFTYSDAGGTVSQTTVLTISGATLSNPAGTVNMSCPLTYLQPGQWTCVGGSVSIQSSDGKTAISGVFTSGIFTLSTNTYRGGTTYYYAFSGDFSGSQTLNGVSAAVLGGVSEVLAPLNNYLDPLTGTIQTGIVDISQQYEPVYVADTGNNRIVQTADMLGSNWVTFGKIGAGVNQFSQPWGVVLDSSGKIYVSDGGNCRIVRMDNMSGRNWTSFGTCGSGNGQFSNPKGLYVDSSGKIYVADSGNNRVVRMDDITGANFTSLGTLGSGQNQFDNPSGVAIDSAGNIYIADATNARIVEVADMSGTNWATLDFFAPYFTPTGIWLDSTNQIYFADATQEQVIRVDNISGANQVDIYGFMLQGPSGIFVDRDGAFYVADTLDNRVVRDFDTTATDVFAQGALGTGVGNFSQPHGVYATTVTKSVAVASVAPPSLAFPTEVVGSVSPPEATVLTNIGTATLKGATVASSSADFPQTNNCPATLTAGQSCSASVTFQPTVAGKRKGSLSFKFSSGPAKSVPLSGSGALVTVYPTELIMYEGAGGTVTVTNPLSTPTTLRSITISGDFQQTNNCKGTLNPSASCSVTISWSAVPPVFGTLTVTDASGTPQYVELIGE